jgi:hypothetical protein
VKNLLEKRREPHINTKLSPFEELSRLTELYGDTLYISFTQGFGRNRYPKLGINPRSGFKTPLGIYCYRASYVLDFTEQHQEFDIQAGEDNGGLSAPFTGYSAWHHAWVFRLDETDALRGPMVDFDDRVEDLRKHWNGSPEDFNKILTTAHETAEIRSAIGVFWNFTRLLVAKMSGSDQDAKISLWNKFFRMNGYTMAEDRGAGFIFDNEPEQCVIFDPRIIRPVTIISRSESIETLNHKSKKRAVADPAILNKLPSNVVARLSDNAALTIVQEYMAHIGNTTRGMQFMDDLPINTRNRIAPVLANSQHAAESLVGWHAMIQSGDYSGVRKQGIANLAQYTDYKIDKRLAEIIARHFNTDSHDTSSVYSLDNIPDAILKLMRHPERFVDFKSFVATFVGIKPMYGKFQDVIDFAERIFPYVSS